MLPSVLRYNEGANADRQALVAEAFGRAGEPAWLVVHEFIAALGLPRSLAAVGVTPEQFETVAKAAHVGSLFAHQPAADPWRR